MKKILVLGTGFIGSEIVIRLHKKFHIICIDHGRNFTNLNQKCENVEFVKGDCFDMELLKKNLKNCNKVIFCINGGGVYDCKKSPEKFNMINTLEFQKVIKILENFNQIEFFLFSTGYVYPDLHGVGEDVYPAPSTEYGKQRWNQEQILRNSKIRFTILRLSNIFGYGNIINIGNLGAVEKFIEKGFLEKSITLHGDGKQKLDLLSKEDLIDLIEIIIEKNSDCSTYNVCSGKQLPIFIVAEIIQKIIKELFEINVKIKKENPRIKFPDAPLMSNKKILTETTWFPKRVFTNEVKKMIHDYGSSHKW